MPKATDISAVWLTACLLTLAMPAVSDVAQTTSQPQPTTATTTTTTQTAQQLCSDPLFSPIETSVRDAYLLTEGESLRLSCGVCGRCLRPLDPGCSDRTRQAWMSADDAEEAKIVERTKIKRVSKTPQEKAADKAVRKRMNVFRRMGQRIKAMKAKIERAKKRVIKLRMQAVNQMAVTVQRFDRLKRLGMESESGVGIFKQLWQPDDDEAKLQWFKETAKGDMSRVKHESSGIKLLFDLLVISRANTGNTGTYVCRWYGHTRARFSVTVLDGGVEPYREFEPSSGRSLQPKLMPKANLEVYTRWMDRPLSVLLPSNESLGTPVDGKVDAVNVTITWGICYVKQLDPDKPVKPEGSPALKLMPHGLPCRSHLLPVTVRSLRSIVRRPSETRKQRTIVRVAESEIHFGLGGANYTTASPPPLSVDATVIKRSFMMAKQSEFVSLECPLKQTVRTLIIWFVLQNDSDRADRIKTEDIISGAFNPYDVRETSLGRVFTDPGGNLNLANVSRSVDQRKYFCIHKGRLVGYVNLIIRHAKEESYIMYVTSLVMNVLRVASPMVITASIIFLTLVTASSMFEPEVPW